MMTRHQYSPVIHVPELIHASVRQSAQQLVGTFDVGVDELLREVMKHVSIQVSIILGRTAVVEWENKVSPESNPLGELGRVHVAIEEV